MMITVFRANTPLMIVRQTSLMSNSYGNTTATAPPRLFALWAFPLQLPTHAAK